MTRALYTANGTADALRPWVVPVYAWALAVLLTHVIWSLATNGAPFLVYLSNWLYIANALFYAAVVLGSVVPAVRRIALLTAPVMIATDIVWATYSLGLAVYGAACFGNTQSSTLFYYVFSAAQAYGHFSPLVFFALYAAAEGQAIVWTWAALLRGILPAGRVARACVVFVATLAWFAVPALPCIVYSYATDPLVVYGLTITLKQVALILVYAVSAEVLVALLIWLVVLGEAANLSGGHAKGE